jgi:hypothetical protein
MHGFHDGLTTPYNYRGDERLAVVVEYPSICQWRWPLSRQNVTDANGKRNDWERSLGGVKTHENAFIGSKMHTSGLERLAGRMRIGREQDDTPRIN